MLCHILLVLYVCKCAYMYFKDMSYVGKYGESITKVFTYVCRAYVYTGIDNAIALLSLYSIYSSLISVS